jgi:hypothetical protein
MLVLPTGSCSTFVDSLQTGVLQKKQVSVRDLLSEAVRFLHGDPRNNGPGVADQERIFDAFGYYEDKWNGDRSGRIAFHRRGPRRSGSGQRITQLAVLHSMYLYPFSPLFRPSMSAKCCRDSSYPVLAVVQPKVPLRETAPVQCSQADRLREELPRRNPGPHQAYVRNMVVIGAGPAGLVAAVYGAPERPRCPGNRVKCSRRSGKRKFQDRKLP